MIKIIDVRRNTIVIDQKVDDGIYYNERGFKIELNFMLTESNLKNHVYGFKCDNDVDIDSTEYLYHTNPNASSGFYYDNGDEVFNISATRSERIGRIYFTEEQANALKKAGNYIKDVDSDLSDRELLLDIASKVDMIFNYLFKDEIPADSETDDYIEDYADESINQQSKEIVDTFKNDDYE